MRARTGVGIGPVWLSGKLLVISEPVWIALALRRRYPDPAGAIDTGSSSALKAAILRRRSILMGLAQAEWWIAVGDQQECVGVHP